MTTYRDFDGEEQQKRYLDEEGTSSTQLWGLAIVVAVIIALVAFASFQKSPNNTVAMNSPPGVHQPTAPPSPSGLVPPQAPSPTAPKQ